MIEGTMQPPKSWLFMRGRHFLITASDGAWYTKLRGRAQTYVAHLPPSACKRVSSSIHASSRQEHPITVFATCSYTILPRTYQDLARCVSLPDCLVLYTMSGVLGSIHFAHPLAWPSIQACRNSTYRRIPLCLILVPLFRKQFRWSI